MKKELTATVSSQGLIVIPGDVRRLKGRLGPPAAPASVDDMNLAIAEQRTRIGKSINKRQG